MTNTLHYYKLLSLSSICISLEPCLTIAAPIEAWSMGYNGNGDGALTSNDTASPIQNQERTSIEGTFPIITLKNGGSITLSGKVSFSASTLGNQFRFGLFDSNTTKGYFSESANNNQASALTYSTSNSPHYFVTSGSQDFSDGPSAPKIDIAAGTEYSFSLKLTRNGSEIMITSSLTGAGYSSSVTETTSGEVGMGKQYTFDKAAFLIGGGAPENTIASYSEIKVVKQGNSSSGKVKIEPNISKHKLDTMRLFGIDFNRNETKASPTQKSFKVITGSPNKAAPPHLAPDL